MRKKYVIAVSGGVDSMYLATSLAVKNQAAAFVHINHHTRGTENDFECKLVEELGERYSVPVYVFDYIHKDGNFQAKAREFRYEKFLEVARIYDHKIATAHHLDDQLENCLAPSHLVKSNLIEYRSELEDCYVYRPLLGYRKQDIYNMASSEGIKFNEDISNKDSKYRRNKYRKQLLETEYMKRATKNYIVEYNKPKVAICVDPKPLDRKLLKSRSKTYRYFELYKYLKSWDCDATIKNRQLEAISQLIETNKNSKYSLANCKELFIGYDKIYMLASDETIITESILKVGKNEFNGIEFYSDTDQGCIRTLNSGDRVKLLNGHKKVSRIFIDSKVESHLRKRWPLVTNNDGEIVYIPKIWRKNEID